MKKLLTTIFCSALFCSGVAFATHVQYIGDGRYSYVESRGGYYGLPRVHTMNPDGMGGYYID